jgi:hypothetical protein
MYVQVLTPQDKEAYINLGFTPVALQVMNPSPYPVYLRLGDNLPSSPTSYHYIIPPGQVLTLPTYDVHFSAALWAQTVYQTSLLTQNAYLYFYEQAATVPTTGAASLGVQTGVQWQGSSLASGQSASFIIDARQYMAIMLMVIEQGIGAIQQVLVEQSADTVTWQKVQGYYLDPSLITSPLLTYHPATAGYVRVTITNAGTLTFTPQVIFNTLPSIPDTRTWLRYVATQYTQNGSSIPSGQTIAFVQSVWSGQIVSLQVQVTCPLDIAWPPNNTYVLPPTLYAWIYKEGTAQVASIPVPNWQSRTLDLVAASQTVFWNVPIGVDITQAFKVIFSVSTPTAASYNLQSTLNVFARM